MKQNNMYTILTSLNICIFLLILLLKKSHAEDYRYEACLRPGNCTHGPDITFPFYIQDFQEPYCGYPGFHVNCSETGFPILDLSHSQYVMEDIFYENRSLRVFNSAFSGLNRTSCFPRIQNTTLPSQFSYVNRPTCLNLFYNCTHPLHGNLSEYRRPPCDDDDDYWDLGLCDDDENLRGAIEMCERNIVVPVERPREFGIVNVVEALRRGFVMNWTASDCSECQESGGRCGFNSTTYLFSCFCPDMPHSGSCKPENSRKKVILAAGISGGSVILIVLVVSFAICYRKKKIKGAYILSRGYINDKEDNIHQVPQFSLESIEIATKNFSSANKLGEGGFGPVYKGELLNGQEIAIKRLSRSSGQGLEEFQNEILLIAKLQHNNLVKLLGSCIQGQEMILVYEYMPNKSLDFFLFDPKKRELLKWTDRMNIIEGVAQGLAYLHKYSRLKVIHRDLKASNILLDHNMNPKVSDFGLARIFEVQESEANTKRLVGTHGYMSPEYIINGVVSTKTDVFSYGVLLLEIVSGKRNRESYDSERPLNLTGLAWELWVGGKALELIDPILTDPNHNTEVIRCIIIGLLCVQDSPSNRPSMIDVAFMLKNECLQLPNPKQPAFFISSNSQEAEKEATLLKICTNGLSVSQMEAR